MDDGRLRLVERRFERTVHERLARSYRAHLARSPAEQQSQRHHRHSTSYHGMRQRTVQHQPADARRVKGRRRSRSERQTSCSWKWGKLRWTEAR